MSKRPKHRQEGRAEWLVDAVIDGIASAEEVAKLDQLLQSSAEIRQYYRDASELNASLQWMHRASELADVISPQSVSLNDNDRIAVRTRRTRGTWSSVANWMGSFQFTKAATFFCVLASLAAALFYSRVLRMKNDQALSGSTIVAELRSDDACVWSSPTTRLAVGSELRAGDQLALDRGVARLWFRSGATVLVESPTTFELVSEKSLRLVRGTVAVRASGPVKDFVVISPDASVLDKGTSFAVHCDENSATEVEVFEGAVEVCPESDPKNGRMIEMGTNVSVGRRSEDVALFASPPDNNRFAPLLERLWQDIRVASPPSDSDDKNASIVEAEFTDAPGPMAVDTFYGAKPHHGWLTPWVAAGNPTGLIRRNDPDFGLDDACLQLRFGKSFERAVAREYGPRGGFDPKKPHIISWRWRLEGNPDEFGSGYNDRIAFYGNPYFRRNTWPTNSWLIGVASADEPSNRRRPSNEWLERERGFKPEASEIASAPRRVFPKRWYFFDSQDDGAAGSVFDRRNMVDTGMKLRFGVVYRFAVAVYPEEHRYDAAIRDDERTIVRTGLHFRDRNAMDANVFHATVSVDSPTDERGFSFDSLRVQPLKNLDIKQQLEKDDPSPGESKR